MADASTATLNERITPNTRLYIGNMSWSVTDSSLRASFESRVGEYPTEATVIVDRKTGRSRGFGFVSFATEEISLKALETMNNKEIEGRQIRVSFALSPAPRKTKSIPHPAQPMHHLMVPTYVSAYASPAYTGSSSLLPAPVEYAPSAFAVYSAPHIAYSTSISPIYNNVEVPYRRT